MKRHLALAWLLLGLALMLIPFTVFLNTSASDAISDLVIRTGTPIAPTEIEAALPATFTVTNTNDTGLGSLRAAIDQANTTPGADLIDFNPGLGTINVGSVTGQALPDITEAVTIDGGSPRVELNGAAAGAAANGLAILAPGVTVRGLVINRFSLSGISIQDANCIIQGNFIGTDAAGSGTLANAGGGVLINGPGNLIGGTALTARNIISGNGGFGIEMSSVQASNNTIQGNFIGTDVNGTADLGNIGGGVRIADSSNNTIGGTAAGARNIISGNGGAGVSIENTSPGTGSANFVQGNFIGTDVTGAVDLGNDSSGIGIVGVPGNIIGGTSAGARNIISGNSGNGILFFGISATGNQVQANFIGTNASGSAPLANSLNGVVLSGGSSNNIIGGTGAGNIIAFNGATGVAIGGGTGNAALSNSIFTNQGLGINLNDDAGVTANDNCDGDSGANNLQNFPVLASASSSPGNTAIAGTLNSTTATTFRIEFFSSTACNPSGNGEGQTFIGFTNVATIAPICDVPINVSFPVAVPAGSVITATATDPSNNTSEFSPCVTVAGVLVCTLTCPPDLLAFTSPAANACGTVVTYSPVTSGVCGTVTCAPPSGSVFAAGTTTVSCTIIGGLSCSFSVTVVDGTPPTINCPTGVTAPLPAGKLSAAVNYPAPTAADNCSGASVVCVPPSGSTFPAGATLVTCTATDASANAKLCFFFVTLLDGEAPVIVCPPNVNAALPVGQTSSVVDYPPPTVTDNFPGVNVVCLPASGSSFPAGSTTVTCTATDAGGNKSSCSFIVGVGAPQAKVTIAGNKTAVEFAAAPTRKPPKPKNSPCSLFTIQNTGFSPLVLTFESLRRTGSDVTNGRISDPNDLIGVAEIARRFFVLGVVNPDQSLTGLGPGSIMTFQPGETKTLCLRFAAFIPGLAGKTTGLAASDVLPDILTSTISFRQNAGANIEIPILARVGTEVVLIDPANPRRPPVVTFTRSGNDITVSYAVFDSNLDVSRAKYEFLDNGGQVVAGPFEIDLAASIRSANLVRGQGFSVQQKFTGASSNTEITSVRLTVFDGETSVGAVSTSFATSISAASVQLMNRVRRVTLYLPDVKLR